MTTLIRDETEDNAIVAPTARHQHAVANTATTSAVINSSAGNVPDQRPPIGTHLNRDRIATERRKNPPADSGIVVRHNDVCQDTQQDYRAGHEVVPSGSSLAQRFYLNYRVTLTTVNLNPVLDIEEVHVMTLDVIRAT